MYTQQVYNWLLERRAYNERSLDDDETQILARKAGWTVRADLVGSSALWYRRPIKLYAEPHFLDGGTVEIRYVIRDAWDGPVPLESGVESDYYELHDPVVTLPIPKWVSFTYYNDAHGQAGCVSLTGFASEMEPLLRRMERRFWWRSMRFFASRIEMPIPEWVHVYGPEGRYFLESRKGLPVIRGRKFKSFVRQCRAILDAAQSQFRIQ